MSTYVLNLTNFDLGDIVIKTHPFLFLLPPALYFKGNKIKPEKGSVYTLKNSLGEDTSIRLVKRGVDPIPMISVNKDEPKNVFTGFSLNFIDQLWAITPFFCLQLSFSIGAFLICWLGVVLNIKLLHKFYDKGWARFIFPLLTTSFIALLLSFLMRLISLR